MVSVCLPSDALSQHLPSYLSFSYLGCGVSLHGCSSKAQPLLLTLDKGYLLRATPPDLDRLGRTAQKCAGCHALHRSLAERTHPSPKVRGGDPEHQASPAQERRRGATPRPRSGAAAEMSYPTPEVRGSGQEEQPHVQGVVAARAQEGREKLLHVQDLW